MNKSLKTIINTFKSFASQHPEIKDFGYGSTYDIGTSRSVKYPLMWATYDRPSEIYVSPNKAIIPTLNFTFIIVDRVNNAINLNNQNGFDSNNQGDVISDTFQMIEDLIHFSTKIFNLKDITFNPEVVQDEITKDLVLGWKVDISIKKEYLNCIEVKQNPNGQIVIINNFDVVQGQVDIPAGDTFEINTDNI